MAIDGARVVRFVGALVLVLQAAAVVAQAPAADPVAAEALYNRGRELLKKGERDAACEKFDASMAMNPRALTLLNVAECRAHAGKLTEALADYKRALVMLPGDALAEDRRRKLEKIATTGIAEIEPRLARLELMLEQPIAGLEVRRDGTVMPPGSYGESIPVDPGAHELAASAPGYETKRETITLQEKEVRSWPVALAPLPAPEPPPPPPQATASTPPAAPPAPPVAQPDKPSGGRTVPTWAWVTGGVGLALICASIPFKLDSAAGDRAIADHCGEDRLCGNEPTDAAGYDPASDNARKNRGFGLFVGLLAAGGVGVGAGLIGIVAAKAKAAPPAAAIQLVPFVSPRVAGFDLRATF